jgi:hypothetical protein
MQHSHRLRAVHQKQHAPFAAGAAEPVDIGAEPGEKDTLETVNTRVRLSMAAIISSTA